MIIDGKKIAAEILEKVQQEVAALSFRPKLIDVLVGADPVTESYVKIKAKRAAEVGIDFEIKRFPAEINQEELEKSVRNLNATENLCGLIIQLPLPKHLDKQNAVDQIYYAKDVDLITSENIKKMYAGAAPFQPATAAGILKILESLPNDPFNKKILVIGHGDLVGKPVAFLLRQRRANVTVADLSTTNLSELCRSSEVIISGTGQPKLIKADMVSEGTIVIDAGTAESAGGITGDVDFESVKDRALAITPVPGGVGPVTVAMLLYNVLQSAKNRR